MVIFQVFLSWQNQSIQLLRENPWTSDEISKEAELHFGLTEFKLISAATGRYVDDFSISPLFLSIHYSLLGGKGGFGANLKRQGSRMAGKHITNFEACRDIHGNRLRTLNDAKRLA